MVLDNRTYDGLAGKWRDLADRLKWDIIKSVLKSLGGFQGKKVKVGRLLVEQGRVCLAAGGSGWQYRLLSNMWLGPRS